MDWRIGCKALSGVAGAGFDIDLDFRCADLEAIACG
jgi:hypothetical protein